MIRDTHYPLLQLTDQIDRTGHVEIGLALHQPGTRPDIARHRPGTSSFSHLPEDT